MSVDLVYRSVCSMSFSSMTVVSRKVMRTVDVSAVNLMVVCTAMGTRMAPSYANQFMAKLEKYLMATNSTKPKVWWRYTDDIVTIWEHGQESLKLFLQHINLCIPSQLTPTSTYHPIAVIPNTAPPQSHTARASDSGESAQEERTL